MAAVNISRRDREILTHANIRDRYIE